MNQLPEQRKPLEHFLSLSYPIEIAQSEGAWVASIPDLPGCSSFGDTVAEAVENIQKTKHLWIEVRYRGGAEIPEPTEEEDFSGKFLLRIPRSLHRSLAHGAEKQGVSLNHYVCFLLSQRGPLQTFETLANSILNSVCAHTPRIPWVWSKHERDNALIVGRLPGEVEFVGVLRKPPAECSYKKSLPHSLKKEYRAMK